MIHHYRVDNQFSNSFEKWKAMGKPQQVSETQYHELEKSGQLQLYTSPEWKLVKDGKVNVEFSLPSHGVSLIQLSWE